MIIVIDKKQMYDSVITGKGNASKEWNVLYWCFWQVLCLVMHALCICLKTASWLFWGQGLAFFGEDRLASLFYGAPT